ncbi:class I adenylate-forming enzyme family protein [Nocardioides marmotae]|uniref:class I adenylate-forming enzyme family protein n=1 Tax=Nocardioides marmotae TaxID=2663857 RepID=UPI001324FF01|nr:class I adenylate-forming enzyme family protein [Nocardioides marmotae]MBC9732343.1 acyl--CoA ligase [Nocardioides marmotae]MTB83463.1 AMP-binding protein [Nocardioides marmotae]
MNQSELRQRFLDQITAPTGAFPVTTAEVRGVTLKVYRDAPNDLGEIFAGARRFGDARALTYEDENYTWDEYLDLVGRFAAALVDTYGIEKGDRVAFAMRNYPEWLVCFAAAVSVGAVAVPLNAWWSAQELQFALQDCGARIFVGDRERVERVQDRRSDLPAIEVVVEVRPGDEARGDVSWEAILADHPGPLDISTVALDPEDDCTIMYTSGTTGQPKGAVATHRSHVSNLYNMLSFGAIEAEMSKARGEEVSPPPERPVSLVTGPMFHIAGLPSTYLCAVTGVQLVLMYKWDAERAVELIEREQVTSVAGVPTVVRQLLDAAELSSRDVSSLRTVGTGGAQSSSKLIGRIKAQFGGAVGTGTAYGLTETTGPMVGISSYDYFERPLAVGVPYPVSEVRLVGPDGRDVPPGELGETWFRGPNISRGYWNRQTDAFLPDGWFRSGDLCRQDEDGFVYIVDRIKDIVIKAGENVYCSEVEDAIFSHPAVQEVAVFGRPHELWGEEVVAVVQTKPGATLTEAEIGVHVRAQLAAFKVPTALFISEQPLPRNATGKVLKRELREQVTEPVPVAAAD